MAQGALTRLAAAGAALALGAFATASAASASTVPAVADFAVGAVAACGGAWLLGRAPWAAWAALATAVAWSLGTLSASTDSTWSAIGSACVVAYRGPLLGLLLVLAGGRAAALLASAACVAGLLPIDAAGPATVTAAVLTAALTADRSRTATADRRPPLPAAAVVAGVLAAVWAAAPLLDEDLALVNDAAVLAALAVGLSAAGGRGPTRRRARSWVTLGPASAGDRPITARLSHALADPDLELRYAIPGLGWVDERGRAATAGAREARVTRAAAPGGGHVELLHGPTAEAAPRLTAAAAAAAALALDSARLEGEIRARAADLYESRRRVLTAADDERRALEKALNDSALAALRRAEALLDSEPARKELQTVIAELTTLARGLYPPALAHADLAAALAEIAVRSPIPTSLDLPGTLPAISHHQRAAAWFVCSEALTNTARHAGASKASISLLADDGHLHMEIRDNGRGGATATRGLRGLADRLEALAGTLTIDSPPGGPTVITARLPLADAAPRRV